MKRLLITLGVCFVVTSAAMAQEVVPFTSFENDDNGLWTASGGMAAFSLSDVLNPDFGVQPQDGDWHLEVNYDLELGQWNSMNIIIPEGGTVDITGMRELHFFTYFPEDAASHQDGGFRMRVSLGGGRELGTQERAEEDVVGQWTEWVFPIDHIIYTNQDPSGPATALDRVQLYVNPGGNADVEGTFFLDNIFFSRPDNVPNSFDIIQLWSFDEDEDEDIVPDGWQMNGQQPFIGDGAIEPSEGSNYMELTLAERWTANGASADAKARSDRLVDAWDVLVDVYLPEEFTGGWLNLQIVMQSGGQDAEGNDLAPVSGWDQYGERAIAEWEKNQWHTIAWPVNMENHRGALEDDGGWFQYLFATNQPADQAGVPIYIDNFRIAVPSSAAIDEWSLF